MIHTRYANILLTGFILIGVIVMTQPSATAGESMEQQNVETTRVYLKAIEAGETEGLRRFFTEDTIQHELPNLMSPHAAKRNLDEIIEGSKRGAAILQSQAFDIQNVVAQGDHVVVEYIWRGVLSADVATLKAGDTMTAHAAVSIRYRDGRIAYQRNYDCYEPLQ